MGPRSGLDDIKYRRILPCQESIQGRPARSQSLYHPIRTEKFTKPKNVSDKIGDLFKTLNDITESAVKKLKNQNIKDDNFAFGSVWV
jgi:hypothetical protein